MLKSKYLTNKFIQRETSVSSHINIVGHYDDSTLIDHNDRLIKIFKLTGINGETAGDRQLDIAKKRRNALFKSYSSEFGFYFWDMRSRSIPLFNGEFPNDYSGELNSRYSNEIKNIHLFSTDHYVAIMTKRPEGLLHKSFNLIKYLTSKVDKSMRQEFLYETHRRLVSEAARLSSSLSNYACQELGVYTKKNVKYSSALEFLSKLVNGRESKIPLSMTSCASMLSSRRIAFNNKSGTVILGDNDTSKTRYAAVLAIKGYQAFTYQGIFDSLRSLGIEYVLTQSYRGFDNHYAKSTMRDHQKDMSQSKDESQSQLSEIDIVFDETASGTVGYGIHHFNLLCYADSQKQLDLNVSRLTAHLSDIDLICIRETVGTESAYWAQLPANFGYILRPAVISTKNLASFVSFHNITLGKSDGNHWGKAVTVLETNSGSPYHFNFHYKDVGNFLVYGAMGSGKTVLVGFLIAQSMQFGGKRIIFDKDRGLEILVRALGGSYEIIKPGIRTGFNPCQLPESEVNKHFLMTLFTKMLGFGEEKISAQDAEIIQSAIAGMYRLDPALRRLRNIAAFFGVKKAGGLRDKFDQWHSEGVNAWLFDNELDQLNLSKDVIGFDLGHILDDIQCKTPALMYLIFRSEDAIDGQRGMLFCDEGWLALNDEYFKSVIDNWSRTPRKKNNIFGLATQVVGDTTHSHISKSLNESAFCRIFFPNSSADRDVYINELGLSEQEYQIIKTMSDDQHYFLLVHGRGEHRESVIARVNLTNLMDDINIISGREHTLEIMNSVIDRYGDDPKCWLSHFHASCKEIH